MATAASSALKQANIAALFDLYDADKNGALSGAEAVRGPLRDVMNPPRPIAASSTFGSAASSRR